MPSLSDWQQAFAAAVLQGVPPALDFAPARVPPAAALAVHRNTILGALTGALRQVFPRLETLVGTEWFDQTAAAFARAFPPRAANLAAYGDGFAEFVQGRLPPDLGYLAEVARFERALDRAVQAPESRRRFALDDSAALTLPGHLAVLRLSAPADLICDALGDDVALAALDLCQPRALAIWRKADQAAVWPLRPAAAAFLAAILDGAAPAAALAAALAQDSGAPAIIQQDIFAAPFCAVISQGEPT